MKKLLMLLMVLLLVGCTSDTKIEREQVYEMTCESRIVQIGFTMFDVCDFTAMMGNITEGNKTVIRLWLDNGEVLNLTYHDKDSMLVDYNKLLSEVSEEPKIEYVEIIVEKEVINDIHHYTMVGVPGTYTEEEVLILMDDIFYWVFNAIDTFEDHNGYVYTYDQDTQTVYYTSDNINDSSGFVTLAEILEEDY